MGFIIASLTEVFQVQPVRFIFLFFFLDFYGMIIQLKLSQLLYNLSDMEVTDMSQEKKPYFPMFVDLSQKKVVVVGAGTIAKRRIRTLLEFTNQLVVIAPEVNRELLDLEKNGKIQILRKKYQREDIYDADMVIAATNDSQINTDIYNVCKCTGITVNVCSDKHKCDFYFPGIARKENVVIGVTASGDNHRAARETVEKIRKIL